MSIAESDLTPARIVAELDRYVVGQKDAKRAVAVAIRNRWRRMQLSAEMREEVLPKNILLIGPTGVGKTEIARRIATLIGAPFTKVEATKFTEVGYVGRDVEQIVRDLVEAAIGVVRGEARKKVERKAREAAESRVLDSLVLELQSNPGDPELDPLGMLPSDGTGPSMQDLAAARVRIRERMRAGALNDREVAVQVRDTSQALANIFSNQSFAQTGMDLQGMFDRLNPSRVKSRRMKVSEALETLAAEEAEDLVDEEGVSTEAIRLVENSGIVFLDEIDKVAGKSQGSGPDVSREGVQRDLLPLVEGSTVSTRHGPVRTDHILFIGAGAFHVSKPSDLLPELQGRFPIRVRLEDLTEADFVRILEEPKNALTRQYEALLDTEGLKIGFTKDGIVELARVAAKANAEHENIGARRLATVMERVLEDVSFNAPDLKKQKIQVNEAYVRERVGDLLEDRDLGRYVL
ncbi:MAG: ATP-dependent protease ATPase subunit HslU [Planctomycetota bacterium]|nr:ATP-dependent protease ATPase subunit HslU [Planctomycetota bacterium]